MNRHRYHSLREMGYTAFEAYLVAVFGVLPALAINVQYDYSEQNGRTTVRNRRIVEISEHIRPSLQKLVANR